MRNTSEPLRIVVTGGHLTPAVATMSSLKRRIPDVDIRFIGRATLFDNADVRGHEKETVEALGVSFVPLTTGRLMKDGSLFAKVSSLIKVPFGFAMAFWYLLKIRPDVIVSFGGYIAVPVVIAGWIMDIPIITHEQTHIIGIATKIIAPFASVVCVSDTRQLHAFPFVRSVYTGLPLRDAILQAARKKRIRTKKSRPLIIITGGTSGAVSLNTMIYDALPELLIFTDVIHQVGRTSIDEARRRQKALPIKDRNGYIVVEYMDEVAYLTALSEADIVVGRSGANTVAEIAALGKSAIFIPLPWAWHDEQYKNAQVLEKAGSASIIRQENVTSKRLVNAIRDHIEKREIYQKSAAAFAKTVALNGAENLVDEIVSLRPHQIIT